MRWIEYANEERRASSVDVSLLDRSNLLIARSPTLASSLVVGENGARAHILARTARRPARVRRAAQAPPARSPARLAACRGGGGGGGGGGAWRTTTHESSRVGKKK